jgi:hypothetical protein
MAARIAPVTAIVTVFNAMAARVMAATRAMAARMMAPAPVMPTRMVPAPATTLRMTLAATFLLRDGIG